MRTCKKCLVEKPLDDFYVNRGYRLRKCKPCHNLNRGKPSPEDVHRYKLKHRFGMSPEDYDALLSAQGGRCGICSSPPDERRLAVDHCHETGAVRGLLCTKCNTALGLMADDTQRLQAAIDYLKEHSCCPSKSTHRSTASRQR